METLSLEETRAIEEGVVKDNGRVVEGAVLVVLSERAYVEVPGVTEGAIEGVVLKSIWIEDVIDQDERSQRAQIHSM